MRRLTALLDSSGACKLKRESQRTFAPSEWDIAESAGVIVNMSVWISVEALADWVFGKMHREVLRCWREWFHRVEEATTALWWVLEGRRPAVEVAETRSATP